MNSQIAALRLLEPQKLYPVLDASGTKETNDFLKLLEMQILTRKFFELTLEEPWDDTRNPSTKRKIESLSSSSTGKRSRLFEGTFLFSSQDAREFLSPEAERKEMKKKKIGRKTTFL